MKQIKRFLIERLEWFDVHVLDHRWYWLCQLIGTSNWWATVNLDHLSLEQVIAEITRPYPSYEVGQRYNREKVKLLLDFYQSWHEAMTGDTIPASKLRELLEADLVKYDAQTDILRIRLSDVAVEESKEIQLGLIVDYDAMGNVVGIELLDASDLITVGSI